MVNEMTSYNSLVTPDTQICREENNRFAKDVLEHKETIEQGSDIAQLPNYKHQAINNFIITQ